MTAGSSSAGGKAGKLANKGKAKAKTADAWSNGAASELSEFGNGLAAPSAKKKVKA